MFFKFIAMISYEISIYHRDIFDVSQSLFLRFPGFASATVYIARHINRGRGASLGLCARPSSYYLRLVGDSLKNMYKDHVRGVEAHTSCFQFLQANPI